MCVCVCVYAISELDYLIHLTLHSDNSCRLASGGHNAAAATLTPTPTATATSALSCPACWLGGWQWLKFSAHWRRLVNRIIWLNGYIRVVAVVVVYTHFSRPTNRSCSVHSDSVACGRGRGARHLDCVQHRRVAKRPKSVVQCCASRLQVKQKLIINNYNK